MRQHSYILQLQRCIVQIVQQMLKIKHFSVLSFLSLQVNSERTLSKKKDFILTWQFYWDDCILLEQQS